MQNAKLQVLRVRAGQACQLNSPSTNRQRHGQEGCFFWTTNSTMFWQTEQGVSMMDNDCPLLIACPVWDGHTPHRGQTKPGICNMFNKGACTWAKRCQFEHRCQYAAKKGHTTQIFRSSQGQGTTTAAPATCHSMCSSAHV